MAAIWSFDKRGSRLARSAQRRQAEPREFAEIGVDGVAMDLEELGDR
jgi:hypothetical protein